MISKHSHSRFPAHPVVPPDPAVGDPAIGDPAVGDPAVRDPREPPMAFSPPASLLEADDVPLHLPNSCSIARIRTIILRGFWPAASHRIAYRCHEPYPRNLRLHILPRHLDSASISDSIFDYEFENGRRYHAYKAGSYPLPNDETDIGTVLQQELNRIDIKHHVALLLAGGNLHLAPLHNPRRILDIGTGTGIWAIEMAEQYPRSHVIGTDLSPVQPTWVPDNVRFEIDDCEARSWTWPENHFDYIHTRFMIASIGNWASMIRKAYKHTKPGGYFELQELDCRFRSDDGTLLDSHNLTYWSELITEAAINYNRPIPRYTDYIQWFEKAGFEDIRQVVFKSAMNPWPKNKVLKEAGKFQLLAHIEGLEGISLGLLTRGLKWKADEVKVLMAKIRPELKDRGIHAYQTKRNTFVEWVFRVFITGRKPEHPQHRSNISSRHGSTTAPLTPTSFSSSVSHSPETHDSPAPPEEINAFTPVMPVVDAVRRPIECHESPDWD
ncbi:MAG: hypothetical protein L6R40_005142 [Gallowayella cf. fulva]|nr:MAG: hypothetical protein L6R40_005142 [Xanthomendoza cf. fulva]